jgi:predicted Zn-dependent protease
MRIRRRLKDQPELNETTREFLDRYRDARPVDPWPDQLLAAAARKAGDFEAALPNLRRLDALEERDPAYSLEIARLEREAGHAREALHAVEKAARIDGYDPATRELAAAIAIEVGELATAMRHLRALRLLEPEVQRHVERIERLRRLMDAKATPPG